VRKGSYDELISFSENNGIPLSFTVNEEDLYFIMDKDKRRKIIDLTGYKTIQKNVVGKLKGAEKVILLPAGARDDKVRNYCSEFSGPNVVGLAFTKLDEEEAVAHMFNNLIYLEQPLCFLTTGLDVNDLVIPDTDTFFQILLEGNICKTKERKP